MSELEIRGLTGGYGLVTVLHGIDLSVPDGQVVAVLGANGAGKTTLLRAISGALGRAKGSIQFDGTELVGLAAEKIARLGICHVPEGRGTFVELTVAENLAIGAWRRRSAAKIRSDAARMYEMFPILGERRGQRAGELSGGEQQMLGVARALMGDPKLLLLDEPSLGLAPLVVRQLYATLGDIVSQLGVSTMVVEQNAQLALGIADTAYLLEVGEIVRSGTAADMQADEAIQRAYLGV
ncbi:ABC transporter ATP-binding protein [Desertimonas flava]|uniref:ABC transporter ATP-binding protein n=1 Tax=Desertimonas flava TaxID=2064846 RepID=UPI000E354477|nr:ABC transporter ATP-binding protein [Desertimonas flava]